MDDKSSSLDRQPPGAAAFPPLPSPITQPSPLGTHHDEASAPIATTANDGGGGIEVSQQDVLFGRGGFTNRHIGNLRYRDIIALHRADYVRASKVEKPNVARRIVKAIRSGKTPGRFLRRGDDGKWQEVSDKEATWKASQALREKTRWSSMKEVQAAHDIAEGSDKASLEVEKVVEKATKSVEKSNKRKLDQGEDMTVSTSSQKKAAVSSKEPTLDTLTETSQIQISIPAMAPTATAVPVQGELSSDPEPPSSGPIEPREADVLFGRGGRTNHNPGNIRLREVVNSYKSIYRQAKKVDKPKVAKLIVAALRATSPPSRFLRLNEATNQWEDVGDRRATEKVSQTLREKDRDERELAKVAAAAAEEEDDDGGLATSV